MLPKEGINIMITEPTDEDVICFVNEMKKAILHISEKTALKTFPLDIQRSIVELHRTIKSYEGDLNTNSEVCKE